MPSWTSVPSLYPPTPTQSAEYCCPVRGSGTVGTTNVASAPVKGPVVVPLFWAYPDQLVEFRMAPDKGSDSACGTVGDAGDGIIVPPEAAGAATDVAIPGPTPAATNSVKPPSATPEIIN